MNTYLVFGWDGSVEFELVGFGTRCGHLSLRLVEPQVCRFGFLPFCFSNMGFDQYGFVKINCALAPEYCCSKLSS